MLTTHTANEAEFLSDKIGIMLNSKLIRVNTPQGIVLPGTTIRISSAKRHDDCWTQLCEELQTKLKQNIDGDFDLKTIHSNTYDRCIFQLPDCPHYRLVSDTMSEVQTWVLEVRKRADVEIKFIVTKTSLEQTFMSYAAQQVADAVTV